jgi:CheY-like chemotaxis protein
LLAIDDRAEYLAILQEQAQALGLRVVALQQPALAVAVARAEHPDIIAIDRDMPGTNGFTVARELAAVPELSAVPRILLTASCDLPGILEIQQRGFTAVFTKPSSTEQLRNILSVSLVEHISRADVASMPVRTFAGMRVLVAEDNAINRQVIDAMLQQLGIDKIDNAGDGAEAVELTKRNVYDLIFMDCEMPHMDGYQATRLIREFERDTGRPALAIIALSAHALPEHRRRSLASGMDEHISKPISIAALEEVLARYFRV